MTVSRPASPPFSGPPPALLLPSPIHHTTTACYQGELGSVQEGTTLRSDHCPLPAAPCSLLLHSPFHLMACAQTGSGKTAAFLQPILHRIIDTRADACCARYPKLIKVLDSANFWRWQVLDSAISEAGQFRTLFFLHSGT